MKIFKSMTEGSVRALKSWKVILIVWFVTLLMVSLFVLPAKGILKAGFGSSTITELLRSGINIDVFSDLEQYLGSIISYFSSGFFMFLLLGVLLYAFFAGGLFKSVSNKSQVLSIPCFFRASAKYFWYCLGLWFILALIIIFSGLLIIGLPVGLISQAESGPGKMLVPAIIGGGSLFLVWLIILLLVADYSRAWLISAETPVFFKALGFGFGQTFGHIGKSFLMMLIIMIILLLFGWIVSAIIGTWKPEDGSGVFLLFIVTQILFLLRIFLKVWRYGSVTTLMELSRPQAFTEQ